MRTKLSLLILSLLLLPVLSLAKHMAVLETISQNGLLTLQEKQYLTDILRSQAVMVLPAEQNWTIMTRENINVMLPPGKTIEECEGTCLAETGRNIAADFVAQARISQFGSSYAISVELYETAGNKLISSFNGRGQTVDDIEKIIKAQAPEFFKKARGATWSNFGDFGSSGGFAFQGSQRFIVEIETSPAGAIPTVDGKAFPKCTSTPCKVQLEAGEHRFVLSRERFEDKDTIVKVIENNQKVSLTLSPNIGSLDLRPSMPESFKRYPTEVTIDGKRGVVGSNSLTPGIHEVKITHPCFDPLVFKAAIDKGKAGSFRDSLKRGIGGLELDVYQNGEPHSVPVYFDGVKVGMTPFSGEVPMCTKIEVGDADEREEVIAYLKWHAVVKVTHEMKMRKVAPVVEETRERAKNAYNELDGKETEKRVEPPKQEKPPQKKFWGGVFVAATYNDFYGTEFGFGKLKSGDDYTLKVEGADDILGNYWGVGANIGIGGLYLLTSNLGLRADLGVAWRHGSGKSDVSVKVYWNDESRVPEKSDLEIDYRISQVNIDVPLALRVLLPSKVYAELGPAMSFNLYSKCEFDVDDEFGTQEIREDNAFKLFEFDVFGGVGVMRPIGKSILDFNLRFVLGVTPLNDSKDAPKTWQGQFNIAYWFI